MERNGVPAESPEEQLLKKIRQLSFEEKIDAVRTLLREGGSPEAIMRVFPECAEQIKELQNF